MSLCKAVLSFMVMKRKETQRKDNKTLPGSKGAPQVGVVGCGEQVLVIPSSLSQAKRWCLCLHLSSASLVAWSGSNSCRSSISSFSPFPSSRLHLRNTLTPSANLMVLCNMDMEVWSLASLDSFGQKDSLGQSSEKSLDPRSFLWLLTEDPLDTILVF